MPLRFEEFAIEEALNHVSIVNWLRPLPSAGTEMQSLVPSREIALFCPGKLTGIREMTNDANQGNMYFLISGENIVLPVRCVV